MKSNEKIQHDRDYTPIHGKIFDYWKDKAITKDGIVKELKDGDGIEVITDWGEPCCWACGKPVDLRSYKNYDDDLNNSRFGKIYGYRAVRTHLERCHVVPHSIGGSDEFEGNYFLLCKKCHMRSPDTANPQNFFRWVYRKKTDSLFGMDFRSLYKMVKEECEEQNKDITTMSLKDIQATSCHGNDMADSTMVYALVDTCKERTLPCSTK